ncbi:MAG: DUF167 domain-containing protein [Phycisphaeraceae bacterium]
MQGAADPGAVVTPGDGGSLVRVKVVPGASRDRIAGLLGDRLKLQVSAPPEGGRANKAVCALLAGVLDVARRDVTVASGHTRAEKQVAIHGLEPADVAHRLARHARHT